MQLMLERAEAITRHDRPVVMEHRVSRGRIGVGLEANATHTKLLILFARRIGARRKAHTIRCQRVRQVFSMVCANALVSTPRLPMQPTGVTVVNSSMVSLRVSEPLTTPDHEPFSSVSFAQLRFIRYAESA
jgi:hypothetical protein